MRWSSAPILQTDVWEDEWTDTADLSAVAFAPTFPNDRPFVYYYLRIFQANRQRAWKPAQSGSRRRTEASNGPAVFYSSGRCRASSTRPQRSLGRVQFIQ